MEDALQKQLNEIELMMQAQKAKFAVYAYNFFSAPTSIDEELINEMLDKVAKLEQKKHELETRIRHLQIQ